MIRSSVSKYRKHYNTARKYVNRIGCKISIAPRFVRFSALFLLFWCRCGRTRAVSAAASVVVCASLSVRRATLSLSLRVLLALRVLLTLRSIPARLLRSGLLGSWLVRPWLVRSRLTFRPWLTFRPSLLRLLLRSGLLGLCRRSFRGCPVCVRSVSALAASAAAAAFMVRISLLRLRVCARWRGCNHRRSSRCDRFTLRPWLRRLRRNCSGQWFAGFSKQCIVKLS